MSKQRKKRSNSSVMIVLITVCSLTIMTLLLVLTAFFAGAGSKNTSNDYVASDVVNAIATEKVSVKINMENCTMTVGTKTQVTATLYPNGSSAGIMWTSSDESVFTVDSKGNLEVIGTGIVALTANFGDVYDSIAIECVESEDKAVLNLPDYSMFTNNSGNNKETEKATMPIVETATGKPTESASITATTSTKATTATTATTTAPTTTKATVTTPAETTKKEVETTTLYTLETTTKYDKTIVLSTEIAGRLVNYGFKQYLDNTYVYEDNGAYLGEIIITSNMTHIYIKERSTGFDSAVSSVLTELLPDSHDNIWKIYSGAVTDQTLTVDGRVVRVVVSGDSGHSQIVIYN